MICQSAPPGTTLPLMPGPSNVPPRIDTIRRRPCGTWPISTGAPTVTCSSNANNRPGAGGVRELRALPGDGNATITHAASTAAAIECTTDRVTSANERGIVFSGGRRWSVRSRPRATRPAIEKCAEHLAHRLHDGPAAPRRTENRLLQGGHRLVHAAHHVIHQPLGPRDLLRCDRRRACRVVGDALRVGDDRP